MCQIESVVHVACRHWGKDRFFGEPCPRARMVKNGALLAYNNSPESSGCSMMARSGPAPEATPSQSHNILQHSPCRVPPCLAYTSMPVYERSKAVRDILRKQYSMTATLHTRSRSSSSDSSVSSASSNTTTTSCSTTSTLSDIDICRMQTGYYSSNGAYVPAADPLLDQDLTGSPEQPDEYVYIPCLYATNVGCANGDGLCPRCAVPRFQTPSYGQTAAVVQSSDLL